MPTLEFIGAGRADPDNSVANPARLVNCYREDAGDGKFVIKSVLGMVPFATLEGNFIRAMETVNGKLYAAFSGALWHIDDEGTATSIGTIPDSPSTSIAGNNGNVTIVAGGQYYVWDGEEFKAPETGAFAAFGSVGFAAQRTILTESGGRRIQWSGVADPHELGGLDFATTESRDDNNLRVLAIGGEIWFFKEASIERWYPTGTGFEASAGATSDRGLKGYSLLTRIDAGAFFVSDNNKVYLAGAGGEMPLVSTTAVETSIKSEGPISCFRYEDEGHEFCAITFANRPAWVFDVRTQEWHEREGVAGFWPVRFASYAYGKWLVGDDTGAIYSLERTNADDTDPLIRRMVSRNLAVENKRFRVAELTLMARVGAGQVSATLDPDADVLAVTGGALEVETDGVLEVNPRDPRLTPGVMLRVSGDRGRTWRGPWVRSMGDLGEYDRIINWRSLGQHRNFCIEVSCSEAIDAPFESIAIVEIA